MQKEYRDRLELGQGIDNSGLSIPIQHAIWVNKYRAASDLRITDTWARVAKALAEAEKPEVRKVWEERFYAALEDFRFITAGRTLSGAGTGRAVTLLNCFVMGDIEDSMGGIFQGLAESATTLQRGGGIGHDFSTLRPKGAPVKGVGADASGPVSFMDVWDAMCKTIMSAGNRRGAMMGTMRCDHPDIEAFIEAKNDPARLRNFNLSVLATDAFMQAVKEDKEWALHFDETVYKTLPARDLWAKIMRNAYAMAEPGVIFIDRYNAVNNIGAIETIRSTNPCGEQGLPPYGACCLGSINLAALVRRAFTKTAGIDHNELVELVEVAVRMLDNVIDVSKYPLFAQASEARNKRRIGLGVTGLANALAMCGLHYGTEEARTQAARWMELITDNAYKASIALAVEKGAFPLFDWATYGRPGSVASRYAIPKTGIRNALLTSIAPTGTISLVAGNISSGIEPVFDLTFKRTVLQADGSRTTTEVRDYAYAQWLAADEKNAKRPDLPGFFVTASELSPEQHLLMQAALQPHIDSSISKTINCDANMPFETFQDIYTQAYELGLKGCTAFRPNEVTGSILTASDDTKGQEKPADTRQNVTGKSPANAEELPTAEAILEAARKLVMDKLKKAGEGEWQVEVVPQLAPREQVLDGKTYKLKWPLIDHAIYITINDVWVIEAAGPSDLAPYGLVSRRRPFEIFINSKHLDSYPWTVAVTRMVSGIFRRGGDVSFVVEELKAVFDPQGGAYVNGKYVPSLIAAIGGVIEQHLLALEQDNSAPVSPMSGWAATDAAPVEQAAAGPTFAPRPQVLCKRCFSANVKKQEGCIVCRDCNHSACS
jgi:ribonucleoside-diphosphate reductase alpha chain